MSPAVKMAIAGALLGMLASAFVACGPRDVADLDAASRSGGSRPMDARAFVDTIGVNTHLFYIDTSYGNFTMVRKRLLELGIRHIRDGVDPGRTQRFFRRVNRLGAAGIKSTLIACRVRHRAAWSTYVRDAKRKVRSSLDALEGVNEPDLVAAGTDWARSTRRCQRDIYRQAKSSTFGGPLRVPVLAPSIQVPAMYQLGDVSDRADGGTMHPYPGGMRPNRPGEFGFASQMASVRRHHFSGVRVAVHATETGYHDAMSTTNVHPPASQRAIAIYMPRLFLEHARAGVRRTFVYELVDEHPEPALADVELNFGLFESDWSYKPAATALRNTIALLDSRRRSPRRPLRYALANTRDPDGAGPRGAVRNMLLQEGDGAYWLALWQDSTVWDVDVRADIVNDSTPVRVALGRRMRLRSFRPTQSSAASDRRVARSFTADVGDDVLLIRMSPSR